MATMLPPQMPTNASPTCSPSSMRRNTGVKCPLPCILGAAGSNLLEQQTLDDHRHYVSDFDDAADVDIVELLTPVNDVGSFDHLVGAHQQRGRNGDTEGRRDLEVDGQFNLGGLLHR